MAQKKAKVELAPLFTNKLHSNKFPSHPSPLTPLGSKIGIELSTPNFVPSGGFWQRFASEGFCLPGESKEALCGPKYPDSEQPKPIRLTNGIKKLINTIFANIIQSWPPFSGGITATSKNVLALVNGYAFVMEVFNPRLQLLINKDVNEQKEESVALRLQKHLQSAVSATTTSKQVLDLFVKAVTEQQNVPKDLNQCLIAANHHASVIKRARGSGKRCRNQATWIGLERISEDELEKLTQKHMVETPEQGDMGVKHGAFSNDGYICLQDNTYRICAPLPSDTHEMTSCIFWTKLSSTDNLPTWEKVFGSVVYNIELLDTSFCQDNEQVTSHMKTTIANVISGSSNPLIRGGMVSGGVMTKATGRTSTYGIARDVEINVPKITSEHPTKNTINKIAELQQLRLEMHEVSPVMQARNHAFLEGFMPSFAKAQMETSMTASKARNILGYPHASAFGTYAYCASSHTDNDESSTSGWVMKRASTINQDESNFVWCSHSLVVELIENTFWFWNAPKDKHGTTMNNLALKHPKSYKSYITKEPDRAQWTRASVMTHAVMAADRRMDEK